MGKRERWRRSGDVDAVRWFAFLGFEGELARQYITYSALFGFEFVVGCF